MFCPYNRRRPSLLTAHLSVLIDFCGPHLPLTFYLPPLYLAPFFGLRRRRRARYTVQLVVFVGGPLFKPVEISLLRLIGRNVKPGLRLARTEKKSGFFPPPRSFRNVAYLITDSHTKSTTIPSTDSRGERRFRPLKRAVSGVRCTILS